MRVPYSGSKWKVRRVWSETQKCASALVPPRACILPAGTLSYIFNTFGDGRKFSEIVNEAKAKGYTEPDPRDDLNGTDVARKVWILLGRLELLSYSSFLQ